MRNTIALPLIFCVASFGLSACQQAQSKEPELIPAVSTDVATAVVDYENWTTYNYMWTDVPDVPGYIKWLEAEKIFEKYPSAMTPTCGLLSQLFSQHKELTPEWIEIAQPTGSTASTIQCALWYSGHNSLMGKVPGEIGELPDAAPSILDYMPANPGDLDMLWGSFMGSGKSEYIVQLINVLDADPSEFVDDEMVQSMMKPTVSWSLASNLSQHELVRRVVEQEIGNRSGQTKRTLQEMMTKFNENRQILEKNDGDFSTALLLVDAKELSEFDKPSSQGLVFKPLSEAKRGDHVAVKIMFTGMELTEDLSGDVTFDLTVIQPDGTIYDGADIKDAPAMKRRIPNRFNMHNSDATMTLRFEPKDQLGLYKINARVTDNIGKKTITHAKSIKLIKS